MTKILLPVVLLGALVISGCSLGDDRSSFETITSQQFDKAYELITEDLRLDGVPDELAYSVRFQGFAEIEDDFGDKWTIFYFSMGATRVCITILWMDGNDGREGRADDSVSPDCDLEYINAIINR